MKTFPLKLTDEQSAEIDIMWKKALAKSKHQYILDCIFGEKMYLVRMENGERKLLSFDDLPVPYKPEPTEESKEEPKRCGDYKCSNCSMIFTPLEEPKEPYLCYGCNKFKGKKDKPEKKKGERIYCQCVKCKREITKKEKKPKAEESKEELPTQLENRDIEVVKNVEITKKGAVVKKPKELGYPKEKSMK
jgi:hypothetical protein